MMLEALFILVDPDLRPAARLLIRDTVEAGFPGAQLVLLTHAEGTPSPAPDELTIRCSRWMDPAFEPVELDHAVHCAMRHGSLTMALLADCPSHTGHIAMAASQLLTRYQHLVDQRNIHSNTPEFVRLLEAHRSMHDLDRPLVEADFRHALDTWRWVLRLDAGACRAVQAAALFHDIERLVSEADRRIEHGAADYQEFKDRHAAAGALIAREVMEQAGLEPLEVAQAERLIREHERPAGEPEQRLLVDADALSFFSLNACGFARHYGLAHTQMKVEWTLHRMSPPSRRRLKGIHHCAHIAALVARALEQLDAAGSDWEDARPMARGWPS